MYLYENPRLLALKKCYVCLVLITLLTLVNNYILMSNPINLFKNVLCTYFNKFKLRILFLINTEQFINFYIAHPNL